MGKTKIEWATDTWNPLRGCSRISSGCQRCYAERMAARGLPGLNSPTTGEPFAIMTPSGPRWTGKVELIESQLDVPLHWKRPRRIFVNSMSDTFHEAVSDEWIDRIFAVMALCPQHTFIALTKRGETMRRYSSWSDICRLRPPRDVVDRIALAMRSGPVPNILWPLPNLWLGVSASTRRDLDAQIKHLRATPAAIRFLSLEPLIEDPGEIDLSGIGWVIVGGESGPGARPCNVEWIRSIVRQCRNVGVPCFVKQLGSVPVVRPCGQHHFDFGEGIGRKARFSAMDKLHPATENWRVHFANGKGSDPAEWPEDLRMREFPEVTR